jgi:small GTP-binding protein
MAAGPNGTGWMTTLKFLFCGADGVGKTTVLKSFIERAPFDAAHNTTLGVDLLTMRFKTLTLQFWDTGGHEIYNSVTYSYYPGADCIVFLYDVSDLKSFLQIEEMFKYLQKTPNKDTPVVVIANKTDLGRKVPMSRVQNTFPCPHYEVCAKHGAEVILTMNQVVRRHCEGMDPNPLNIQGVIRLGARECITTGCCV